MNKISVIIPMLNEADNIVNLLQYLVENSLKKNIAEIIVVDGGSEDGSQVKVEQFASSSVVERPQIGVKSTKSKIILLNSEKGRAKQMNLAAQNATGNIYYFLHADSYPPKNFDTFILSEVEKENQAGCFKMKFDHQHWWLKLASWLTQFSWRACRGGDQSQFITKKIFNEIGGYDETYTIYEDNILINELYKRNEFVVIQQWLTTSARLYKKRGIWNLQYHFWTIYVKKWFGASANDLYAYYKKHIT